jgi:hypothetical protein
VTTAYMSPSGSTAGSGNPACAREAAKSGP